VGLCVLPTTCRCYIYIREVVTDWMPEGPFDLGMTAGASFGALSTLSRVVSRN